PDIELGPIGQRKHTDRFTRRHTGIVDLPHLRALVLRIPGVGSVAEREDALLCPRLFLVAPCAAESRIEAVLLERLAQRQRLHYVRMHARAMRQWADTVTHPVVVDVDQEVETEFIRHPVTKC